MPTVDAVPHKRVHGGGARLRMFVPLVQEMVVRCTQAMPMSSTCKFVAVLIMHILIPD